MVHPPLKGHQSGDLGEGLLPLITGEASLPSPVLLLLVWYQQVPAGACARSSHAPPGHPWRGRRSGTEHTCAPRPHHTTVLGHVALEVDWSLEALATLRTREWEAIRVDILHVLAQLLFT